MEKIFTNKRWIEEKFRKILESHFKNSRVKKIKLGFRKPGLSAVKKRERFFKYNVVLVWNGEIKNKEIFIKKSKKIEKEILEKIQKLKIKAPIPIFYLQKFKTLFYFKLEGIPLQEIIKKEKLDREILEKIIFSLRELQKLKIKNLPYYKISDLNKKAKGLLLAFQRHYPVCEKKAKELIKKILPIKKEFLNLAQKKFTHGDFTPSNIILTPNKEIGVIDFDYSRLDDPLKDAGMFLAQLNSCKFRYNLSPQKIISWQNYFRERYLEGKKSLEKRLNIYQAWEEIHNASIFIKGFKRDKLIAEEMLKEAERLISL